MVKKSYDKTRTLRTARRNKRLNELAQTFGFHSMSNLLTAWLNNKIIVKIAKAKEEDAQE